AGDEEPTSVWKPTARPVGLPTLRPAAPRYPILLVFCLVRQSGGIEHPSEHPTCTLGQGTLAESHPSRPAGPVLRPFGPVLWSYSYGSGAPRTLDTECTYVELSRTRMTVKFSFRRVLVLPPGWRTLLVVACCLLLVVGGKGRRWVFV